MGIVDLQDHKKLEILRSQIEGFKVSDVMDTECPTIGPEDRVKDVLALMKKSGYQDVPVIENNVYVGMMSYGTLLKKKGITGDTKIKNLYSGAPTATDDESLMSIAEKMVTNNSRQIAVISGATKRKLVGVVSRAAIVEVVSSLKTINEIKVWEVMTNPVECVSSDDTLDKAIDLMRALDIRTVPIVDPDGGVKGIIGMKEVIDNNWTSGYRSFSDMGDMKISVSSVCTNHADTVSWDSDIETAAEIMCKNKISTLPVLESGVAVGIISQYDILEIVAACKQRDLLFVQLSGLSDSDKESSDQIYECIQSEVAKISKVGTPSSLTFHYATYNEGGDRKKYSVSGRVALDSEVFTAKEVGWDLVKVSSDLMKKLTNAVMDRKDAKDTFRKRKK